VLLLKHCNTIITLFFPSAQTHYNHSCLKVGIWKASHAQSISALLDWLKMNWNQPKHWSLCVCVCVVSKRYNTGDTEIKRMLFSAVLSTSSSSAAGHQQALFPWPFLHHALLSCEQIKTWLILTEPLIWHDWRQFEEPNAPTSSVSLCHCVELCGNSSEIQVVHAPSHAFYCQMICLTCK